MLPRLVFPNSPPPDLGSVPVVGKPHAYILHHIQILSVKVLILYHDFSSPDVMGVLQLF